MKPKYLYRVNLISTGQLYKERLTVVYYNKTYAYLKVPGTDRLSFVRWERVLDKERDIPYEAPIFPEEFWYDHDPLHVSEFDREKYIKKSRELRDSILNEIGEIRRKCHNPLLTPNTRRELQNKKFLLERKIHTIDNEFKYYFNILKEDECQQN